MRDILRTLNEDISVPAGAKRWLDDLGPDEANGAPEKQGARPGQFLSPYQELEHLRHDIGPVGGHMTKRLSVQRANDMGGV